MSSSTASATRTVGRIQAISSTVEGAAIATVVLYFTRVIGFGDGSVGLVLALAGATALASAMPLGRLADRVGLRPMAAVFSFATAAALLLYAVADELWLYAAAAVLFAVAQAGGSGIRQALVAAHTPAPLRVAARARLQTLVNLGIGAGSAIGALALAADGRLAFTVLFGASAAGASVCGLLVLWLPAGAAPSPVAARCRSALRDRRLLGVTGLTAVLLLTMPVLSVLLPISLVAHADAPAWLPAVALGLNTVLVIALQTRASAWVRTDAGAARAALVAGAALALATVAFAAGTRAGALASVLALAGVAVLTIGEVAAGPAAWHFALRDVPAGRQGEYQSVFGMAGSLARVIGPLALLPLLGWLGPVAWLLIGALLAGAALALAAMGRPRRAAMRSPDVQAVTI
ncbi:MFS transporter [Gryllotalpicola protaetiae]|uniref:MFS transporter n=1 Tax=Gryllotalpicola protaetiae TaxID=2419771 RepID=A0A387BWP4_9MICO|nr:MFS transporter [Gryllotalpicola protaetiae]AYG05329.1 MFS transporter [Gryllotalpicola protaetiae]